MDSSSIELRGSAIHTVELKDRRLRIHFSCAYIVKTMTGSAERTRWWQSGDLILEGAQIQSPAPAGALVCEGGNIDDNIFTYRDMIPIPLNTRGQIRCELTFRGANERLIVNGEALRLEMEGVPKYIEHIRSGD
jgi:hypothetical protein